MKKLGPESPADSDRIKVKAELGEGMVKGLGGSGGQCWIWEGERQAWKQSWQARVSQQWEREERQGSDCGPGNTCPK